MINLLPPEIKEQVRYSRLNAVALRYTIMVAILAVILAGSLLGGRVYLDQQITKTAGNIKQKQDAIDDQKQLEANAKKISERLSSIQTIQKSQAKFSILLADLAQNMPQGSAIASLTLTGDDKRPVRMTVNAIDYKTAVSVREGISKSKRISAADLESIQGPDAKKPYYVASITFAFNPGAAK